jgi:Maltokinase N-terminal cap domain
MTYRGAPLRGAGRSLIATADHSVLGPRWIYDAPADPVWIEQMLGLVGTESATESGTKRGSGRTEARGHLVDRTAPLRADAVAIDLLRCLVPDTPAPDHGVLGVITVTWHPERSQSGPTTACLAVVGRSQ